MALYTVSPTYACSVGVAHANISEDVYMGYRIPARSTIIANQWAILHDPSIFPEPSKFKPERWLDEGGNLLSEGSAPLHVNKVAFGFGRR